LQVCYSLPVELLRQFPAEVCATFYGGGPIIIDWPEVKLVRKDPSNGTKHYEMASKADPKRWRFAIRLQGSSYTISLVKKKRVE
jgi:hypothetical protein